MTGVFVCPVCRAELARREGSLVCAHGHTFDIARQGYVNLLRKKPADFYESKALFVARRYVYEAGFFAPVAEAMKPLLPREGTLLDAGCGEGSLLAALTQDGLRGIGLDIAREAVRMAASAYRQALWCVGDLCDIPLPDNAADVIVNMLTPANYAQFTRVLRPGGLLVKVAPGPGHLCELRGAMGMAPYAQEAGQAASLLEKSFTLLDERSVRYTRACDAPLAEAVWRMTPLTVHQTACPPNLGLRHTVDVSILLAQK